MPLYIVHHKGAYNFYSTIVDAFFFESALTLEQVEEYTISQYGKVGLGELPKRLDRARKTGCSAHHLDLRECLTCNRAGPNEDRLTYDQCIAEFLTL
jgi:hypothetical protein